MAAPKPDSRAAHGSPQQRFVPREHGATAMLLVPFFAAAILLRQVCWQELAALAAVACAFAIKDPLVTLARQRFLWQQPHPETAPARRAVALEALILIASGAALALTRDWRWLAALAAGATVFALLAVAVALRNRQRSVWFQVISAAALTSTSLAASVAVRNAVPTWCWWLWLLTALQAAAGIFVVHARLDAFIASRKGVQADPSSRRVAFCAVAVLALAAIFFAAARRYSIAAALLFAAAGYFLDLRRQTRPASLQMPLKTVGLQALALALTYTLIVILGLW